MLIRQPMTVRQISLKTKIREDGCSFILQELSRCDIVQCLNPRVKRSRLYWLTQKGINCQQFLFKQTHKAAPTYDFPNVDWELYGWVCFNHRSSIIKVMTEPMNPASIRRKIYRQYPTIKISANNVLDILRLFVKKAIAESVYQEKSARASYQLTELGQKLQKLLWRYDRGLYVIATTSSDR